MGQITRKKERRRYSRTPINKMVAMLWDDENGNENRLQGRLTDISVSGARIWIPMKLPARTMVAFSCPTLALGGRGTVRFCNSTKGGYEVGLELTNGTGWNDQNKDLQNLAAGLGKSSAITRQSDATEPASEVVPKNK
jgi:hypothetical protein